VLDGEGFQATALEGGNSQFDVLRDGVLVFSKQREGRFPEEHEVVALLRTPA
jgi:predicted Rdx family selenoprotein